MPLAGPRPRPPKPRRRATPRGNGQSGRVQQRQTSGLAGTRARSPKPDRPTKRSRGKQPRNQPGKRKRDPYKGALYDPTVPLSGKDLAKAADRLARLEFGPQLSALGRAERQTGAQGTALIDRAGDYYNQLAQQESETLARQTAIGQRLQGALQGISGQTQTAMQQTGLEADRRAMLDESVRGAGLEGGGGEALAAELGAQSNLAAQQAQTAQTSAAEGTADYEQLANLSRQATQARGGEIRGQLMNRLANQRADLQGQRIDLQGQRGNARSENLLNLRQTGLENLIAMRGLDIDSAELQADVQKAQAQQRLTRRQQNITARGQKISARTQRRGQNVTARGQDLSAQTQRRGQDLSAQQRAADRQSREKIAAGRKKGPASESTQSKTMRTGIANAIEDIGSGKEKRVRKDAPPLVYRAAREIQDVGFVRPKTLQLLRSAGIQVPRSWVPPTRRRGYKPPQSRYDKGNVPG